MHRRHKHVPLLPHRQPDRALQAPRVIRLPLPHAQGRARTRGLIHKNIIMAMTCVQASRDLLGNRLEALRDDRAGQYSIRVNRQ